LPAWDTDNGIFHSIHYARLYVNNKFRILRETGKVKNILTCFLPALIISACPGISSGNLLKPLPLDAVVLAFGDSLTNGVGASSTQSYPAVLEQLISRRVINAGIPGETTAEGLARLPRFLKQYKPSLVLLCLGANDMLREISDKTAAKNLRSMIIMARKAGADIVLISVPRFFPVSPPPAHYQALAKEFSLPLLDGVLREIINNLSLKSDPIHPNAKGYRILAEELARLLIRSGAVKSDSEPR
jgi:acyl-CoA thioesterase I